MSLFPFGHSTHLEKKCSTVHFLSVLQSRFTYKGGEEEEEEEEGTRPAACRDVLQGARKPPVFGPRSSL